MAYSLSTDVAPRKRTPGVARASPKTHTPVSQLQERGARYYSPELGRWVSRDPIGDASYLSLYFRWEYGVNIADLKGSGSTFYSLRQLRQLRSDLRVQALAPVYLFVHNNSISRIDILGLACTASQGEIDAVAYKASMQAWNDTMPDSYSRERCGMICCKGDIVQQYNHHCGSSCGCTPTFKPATMTTVGTFVSCPSGWNLVAGYHSHPTGYTNFSTGPAPSDESWIISQKVPFYLGVDSKVGRRDLAGTEVDISAPSSP